MSDELEKEVARLTAECAAPNEEAILMFRSAQKTINKLVEDANFLRDDNARLRLELSRRAPTEAAKPEAGLSERLPAWSCSGCGHIHFGDVGRCVGYCQDSSGKSCDAKACPSCGRFHYWTGSIDPKKLEAAKKAAKAQVAPSAVSEAKEAVSITGASMANPCQTRINRPCEQNPLDASICRYCFKPFAQAPADGKEDGDGR